MTACPSDDVLGAMVERTLAEEEAARVADHLDSCDACRQVMIAAVRGAATTPAVHDSARVAPPPKPPGSSTLTTGTRIGRYEIRRLLGAGGMGHVYEAHDSELERSIALKVLRPELVGTASVFSQRLVNESRIMAKVVHRSVVTVYDAGGTDDVVFIAMELVRGTTLTAHIAKARPSWRDIVALYERAGQGLAAAHAAGVIHRDFKPDNVLVELDGSRVSRVIVTDFGIARTMSAAQLAAGAAATPAAAATDVQLTAPGTALGTPAYMAPEQLSAEEVDHRSDVFAFAVSLWESLFGERPFAGKTIAEIRVAMLSAPRAPRRNVPRRLIRALERALAVDVDTRCPDMKTMLHELAAVRARRRRAAIAAGGVGLVGVGIAAALLARPSADDPCARGLAQIATAHDPGRVRAALAADPTTRDAVGSKLASLAATLRMMQVATCHADRRPAQSATTAACLEARRLELHGVSDDLVADGPQHAPALVALVGDPARCANPAPGLLFARVPEDPMLRRKVTAMRYRMFDATAARDHGKFADALAAEATILRDSAIWPPLRPEVLYLIGTTQSLSGDDKDAIVSLREAAGLADSARDNDRLASNSWIQLAMIESFDRSDPTRGLEYIGYADVGAERIGRPPEIMALLEYVKGVSLVKADRAKEGEDALRHAVALAQESAPEYLAQAMEGLGFLYETQGRFADAVAAYRQALAHLPQTGVDNLTSGVIFRTRLAANLASAGDVVEAEAVAREAMAIAEAKLGPNDTSRVDARATLAQALLQADKKEEALETLQPALRDIARIEGERSLRYGTSLADEASILIELGRSAEAATQLHRACEIVAFAAGDRSSTHAECLVIEVSALSGLHRDTEALALMDKVVPMYVETVGEESVESADAYARRGDLHAALRHHDAAIRDLERAAAIFDKLANDVGRLGSVQWALGKELWKSDPKRARELIASAIDHLEHGGPTWQREHDAVTAWLARRP